MNTIPMLLLALAVGIFAGTNIWVQRIQEREMARLSRILEALRLAEQARRVREAEVAQAAGAAEPPQEDRRLHLRHDDYVNYMWYTGVNPKAEG